MPQMKMSDWLEIAANFPDQAAAEQFRIANNIQIVDTGDKPAGGLSTASGSPSASRSGGLSSFADLEKELLAYPEKQAMERKQAFEQGQQYIAQSYAGPSLSQQLFALSKALLSPKPYRGFAGTLANVSTALSDIAKTQQEAKQKRALAEMELKSSFAKQSGDDYYDALKLRYQIGKAEQDAANKAALLGMPKYDPLSSGGYQIRPGTGGLPPMPTMDQYGNYVITDPRQIAFLPPNTKIVRPGDNPMKPKYVPARPE